MLTQIVEMRFLRSKTAIEVKNHNDKLYLLQPRLQICYYIAEKIAQEQANTKKKVDVQRVQEFIDEFRDARKLMQSKSARKQYGLIGNLKSFYTYWHQKFTQSDKPLWEVTSETGKAIPDKEAKELLKTVFRHDGVTTYWLGDAQLTKIIVSSAEKTVSPDEEADLFVSRVGRSKVFPGLYQFLYKYYSDMDILVGPDGPFPISVLPLSNEASLNLDRLNVQLGSPSKVPAILKQNIIHALQRKGVKIWNGPTFSLFSLEFDGSGAVDGIRGFLGRYHDMVKSADYLEYELHAAFRKDDASVTIDSLPARKAALAPFASPRECLQHGGGVDAVIGISTLVVYARESEFWMLCDVRSKSVAEYNNLYHVVPSFIYQPVTALTDQNLAIERSVVHNIFREYLEELFNLPEVQKVGSPIAPDFFYGHANLVLLRELLKTGGAQLHGVALVFNLLTHRSEICSLLLIRDESWWDRQKDLANARNKGLSSFNLNDEFLLNEDQDAEPHPEILTTLPLKDPKWGEVAKPWLMVPPGAPALILGTRLALKLLGRREPDWLQLFRIESSSACR